MIDTRMNTFLTLCTVMNYRKTAELLNLSQPAVTQHIHFLEEQYGCKLFSYDHRKLTMTPEAVLLQRYGENVLYQESRLRADFAKKESITLAIGATKTIGEYVVAPHVSAFLASPSNNLSVNVANTETLLAELSAGKLDFALIEGNFDRNHYRCRPYLQEPFVGICGRSHPFAGTTVTLDEVLGEHLLLREEGSGTRRILEQLLAESNHSVTDCPKTTTISSFGLIAELLAHQRCVTFAYDAVHRSHKELETFCVQGWSVSRAFHYVYLDTPYSQQAVEQFEQYRP